MTGVIVMHKKNVEMTIIFEAVKKEGINENFIFPDCTLL
jgi:hypothetical protein